ncbi:MAG: hypothetical protein MUF44_14705 [Hydrogenophaga sp.]|nr:hypothetical protein [Hydrogenophaga sp.]
MRNTLTIMLSACGEQPQETTGSKQDASSYSGVGKSQYQDPNWKPGDKTSWEQQLKSRAQYGQNDYSRIATQ